MFPVVQIANSGVELKVNKERGGSQTITITRKDGSRVVTETISTSVTKTTMHVTGAKRARMDTPYRRELDLLLAKLNEWFEKTEMNLELLTTEAADPAYQLTLEEQLVLVQVRSFR